MSKNDTDLLKRINEQDAQIKKLISASIALERQLKEVDRRMGRMKHQLRDHTNTIGSLQRTLTGRR